MGSRGLHFDHCDFSEPQRSSSVSLSHVFIIGLILVYDATFSSAVKVTTVKCNSRDVSVTYQHCGIHPDGVHDLDCFRKHSFVIKKNICEWKPGKHMSDNRYTLIIQQQRNSKNYCIAHSNITKFSHEIKLYENSNLTALVFENSQSTNCTKAVFSAPTTSLDRCGPPTVASCSRRSGKLFVNVSWSQGDSRVVQDYQVRYKELGTELWRESPVECRKGQNCTVENLNASQVYSVQIRCVTNMKCSQCVWSEVYTVPSELTQPPVFVNLQDVAQRKGSRLFTLTWKLPAEEPHDGFSVTVGKASGEPPLEKMTTTQSTISLVLSHSAYQVHVSAINNASTSPAVSRIIPRRQDEGSLRAAELNVTANSNSSFTVHWEGNRTRNYVCFSVEWMKKGQKTAYKSFHENKNNYWILSSLSEPLEPYKRYSITLHMRPNKDTCNMKRVNNSEITYGSTQFYFREGTPLRPANINSSNITLDSVVLQWVSIQEEDARGFLLGYTIHYTEYQHRGTGNETSITVDPASNSYELTDLKSGTVYKVQISGFTRAGAGAAGATIFKTKSQAYSLSVIITAFTCGAAVLIFSSPIIKRVKAVLWPSIPNPGNSNAMQKIDWPCELELLESIETLKVEEWDTNSLQIVEKEAVTHPSTHASTSTLPLLSASEDEGDSDSDDATGDVLEDIPAQNVQQTELQTPLAFTSGYTTMEMWQQATPRSTPANASESHQAPKEKEKSGLDYVRQLSTSPVLDKKDMSIIL